MIIVPKRNLVGEPMVKLKAYFKQLKIQVAEEDKKTEETTKKKDNES